LQPPSITVPPYPPGETSPKPEAALASYPSTDTGSTASTAASSLNNPTAPPAEPTGYAVGPYPTATADPAAQQTQQGFYSNPGPPPTATADTRSGYGSTFQPSYGAEQPNSTYSAPTGYGAAAPTGYGAATQPYPAPIGYAGTPAGSADASYPVNPAGPTAGGYPAQTTPSTYPGTQYAGAYPTTGSSYGPPNSAPTDTYGLTPGYTSGPTGYGADTPVYSASAQNSAYGTGAPTGSVAGGTDAGNQYRPGSTARNVNLLSPSGGTRMATPAGGATTPSYPYNR
jgi:hypothetical protein